MKASLQRPPRKQIHVRNPGELFAIRIYGPQLFSEHCAGLTPREERGLGEAESAHRVLSSGTLGNDVSWTSSPVYNHLDIWHCINPGNLLIFITFNIVLSTSSFSSHEQKELEAEKSTEGPSHLLYL